MKTNQLDFPEVDTFPMCLYHQNSRVSVWKRDVCQDGHQLSLNIIRPEPPTPLDRSLPVFLYIPGFTNGYKQSTEQMATASRFALASGHAAVMVTAHSRADPVPLICEAFAAMKWITLHGPEYNLECFFISILGLRLGANIAAVLSLMAAGERDLKVNRQILINPQFYTAGKHLPKYSTLENRRLDAVNDSMQWIKPDDVYSLPFEVEMEWLAQTPPTLIQLSENSGMHYDVDYYYTRLIHAGVWATYTNYDEPSVCVHEAFPGMLSESLINQAAELLRACD